MACRARGTAGRVDWCGSGDHASWRPGTGLSSSSAPSLPGGAGKEGAAGGETGRAHSPANGVVCHAPSVVAAGAGNGVGKPAEAGDARPLRGGERDTVIEVRDKTGLLHEHNRRAQTQYRKQRDVEWDAE